MLLELRPVGKTLEEVFMKIVAGEEHQGTAAEPSPVDEMTQVAPEP
jgi:hypothetical protein